MIEILKLIFSNFWTWLGSAVLLAIFTCWSPIRIIIRRKDDKR